MKGNKAPCFDIVVDTDKSKQDTTMRDNIIEDLNKVIVNQNNVIIEQQKVIDNFSFRINTQDEIISELRKDVAFFSAYLGVNSAEHCIGEDWEWDDMTPDERLKYRTGKKISVRPLMEELRTLDNRVNTASEPFFNGVQLVDNTKMGILAKLFLDYAATLKPNIQGKVSFYVIDIKNWLLNTVDPMYRYDNEGSARSIADKLFEFILDKYPNEVKKAKSSNGNKCFEYIGKRT
jgi:hypothetical protein